MSSLEERLARRFLEKTLLIPLFDPSFMVYPSPNPLVVVDMGEGFDFGEKASRKRPLGEAERR